MPSKQAGIGQTVRFKYDSVKYDVIFRHHMLLSLITRTFRHCAMPMVSICRRNAGRQRESSC